VKSLLFSVSCTTRALAEPAGMLLLLLRTRCGQVYNLRHDILW
jgi:hypothetical protein